MSFAMRLFSGATSPKNGSLPPHSGSQPTATHSGSRVRRKQYHPVSLLTVHFGVSCAGCARIALGSRRSCLHRQLSSAAHASIRKHEIDLLHESVEIDRFGVELVAASRKRF